MYQFKHHKSTSVDHASELHSNSDEGLYLAGGMTLIPSMKLRLTAPTDLIDLSSIEGLAGISNSYAGLRIGAMTRHCEVSASSEIPALASLASLIGDNQVRNRGTIGGSLANNDPAADYPAAVLGLGATIHTNKRDIDGDSFFLGLFETALDEGEIITAVTFPIPKRAAYAKFPNPASRYAIVGAMVSDSGSGIRVGITGAGACAFRATAFESALNEDFSVDSISAIEIDHSDFNIDIHASAEFRGHLIGAMVRQAVVQLTG
ncbi:MAG: xanthine dehydrogenase family protein subunit M [Gammaproteobacteria bacterium]|nr:xanthine dehydrogenase family protein subunit M [Gammaproteobacteria bacterium]